MVVLLILFPIALAVLLDRITRSRNVEEPRAVYHEKPSVAYGTPVSSRTKTRSRQVSSGLGPVDIIAGAIILNEIMSDDTVENDCDTSEDSCDMSDDYCCDSSDGDDSWSCGDD